MCGWSSANPPSLARARSARDESRLSSFSSVVDWFIALELPSCHVNLGSPRYKSSLQEVSPSPHRYTLQYKIGRIQNEVLPSASSLTNLTSVPKTHSPRPSHGFFEVGGRKSALGKINAALKLLSFRLKQKEAALSLSLSSAFKGNHDAAVASCKANSNMPLLSPTYQGRCRRGERTGGGTERQSYPFANFPSG